MDQNVRQMVITTPLTPTNKSNATENKFQEVAEEHGAISVDFDALFPSSNGFGYTVTSKE